MREGTAVRTMLVHDLQESHALQEGQGDDDGAQNLCRFALDILPGHWGQERHVIPPAHYLHHHASFINRTEVLAENVMHCEEEGAEARAEGGRR